MKKISLNLIDRAVALVNPQAGVERAIARAKLTHFNYDATKYNRERKGRACYRVQRVIGLVMIVSN